MNSLKREDVIKLLYGDGAARRFTQDSPVLPDVWIAYARAPGKPQDLLLTPYVDPARPPNTPGNLAQELRLMLEDKRVSRSTAFDRSGNPGHDIAYNQATVVVRLWFDQLVRVILPLSAWWTSKVSKNSHHLRIEELQKPAVRKRIADVLADPQSEQKSTAGKKLPQFAPDLLWTVRVAGLIALANQTGESQAEQVKLWPPPENAPGSQERRQYFGRVVDALAKLLRGVEHERRECPLIYLVSLNRPAQISIWRSTAAIKADAAKNLFKIDCSGLTWAILDSGIDASHPAFFRRTGAAATKEETAKPWHARTRVVATYDFSKIRNLLSADPGLLKELPKGVQRKLKANPQLQSDLRARLQTGHDIDWSVILQFIQVPHDDTYRAPVSEHGTHVAGILAANWPATVDGNPSDYDLQGVCPDINLYDLRVLNDQGIGDEFSVMAAMQFIRHLNAHKDYILLHGVNLSLSIAHDVRNYACGRTPVCEECERLLGAGLVVVAAAGNEGYRTATDGSSDRYESMSITDPGNAEAVITVGSTHRDAPHTYGVSYFSSRGPTGDGRTKPDLVAPGEKIESTIPGRGLKRMDGTSQATPHVSGAAALLMARHSELIGRPARVRQILCETATDLGRERYFQGNGLVDTLRALQAV